MRHGLAVVRKRLAFVAAVKPAFLETFHRLTGDRLDLSLGYKSACGEDPTEESFIRLLASVGGREAQAGLSLAGPHRDDIEFLWSGRPYRDHASLGQSRVVGLVLKCVHVAAIVEVFGDTPVVLLDDVLLELDDRHRLRFREYFGERFPKVQTIETATTLAMFAGRGPACVIEIGPERP